MTKHLKLKPHKVYGDKNAWWYEDGKGISVVVSIPHNSRIVNINWRSIRNALARKDKK